MKLFGGVEPFVKAKSFLQTCEPPFNEVKARPASSDLRINGRRGKSAYLPLLFFLKKIYVSSYILAINN
jgi:hypothetical protein